MNTVIRESIETVQSIEQLASQININENTRNNSSIKTKWNTQTKARSFVSGRKDEGDKRVKTKQLRLWYVL